MIDQEHLDEAERRGIITPNQNAQLRALAQEPLRAAHEPEPQPVNDEDLRLVGGGNDLFVTVGILLLFAGTLFGLGAFFEDAVSTTTVIIAVLIWLVAEFITRQHRMKLSSTVLGVGFIMCITTMVAIYLGEQVDFAAIEENPILALSLRPVIGSYGSMFFGGIALAAVVYFWRFRVPIMAAAIALSLTGLAFLWTILFFYDGVTEGRVEMPTMEVIPLVLERALYIPLLCGMVVFSVAVLFDLRDRERFTVWSDCAFWLHVISAPLLVHPLFILATGQDVVLGEIEPGTNASIMLGVLIIAFVYIALAIDRRSLLIPTLAYF
ncbi:MAG: hypothetical protein AAF870_00450, partial [Pseudomonadota bacterium]